MNILKNGLIKKLDSKVKPEKAQTLFVFFKVSSLLLMTVGILTIIAVFGALVMGEFSSVKVNDTTISWPDYKVSLGLVLGIFIPWLIWTIASCVLWFYFSKWNVK